MVIYILKKILIEIEIVWEKFSFVSHILAAGCVFREKYFLGLVYIKMKTTNKD